MASEIKFSTPPSVSALTKPKIETSVPPFRVATDEDFSEFDDTDWQDYVSQFADRGVRR